LKAKGNYLEKKVIPEEESASWHNTTCYVIKEFDAHLPVMFNGSDANNDGIIDKEEMYNEFFLKIAGMQAPWRVVMVPNEIHDHFLSMDTNQDGLLSFSEYYSVHRVFNYFRHSFIQVEAENFVQKYDSNQDSKVSVKEINSKEFYKNFFQIYDVNHDNFLYFIETLKGIISKFHGQKVFDHHSLSEEDRHIRNHFVIMDYNNDRSISLSEFNKMHLIYADMYNSLVYRDIDSYIEIFDTSLDGHISYMELENGMRIARYFCDQQMHDRFLPAMKVSNVPIKGGSFSKEEQKEKLQVIKDEQRKQAQENLRM